jgi:hypothetical protein
VPANQKIFILYFYFQMKVPQLFPLDASNRAVRILLLCRAILDHMNGELATRTRKHSKSLNRFASWPKAEFTQAFSRQILPRNPGREPRKSHEQPSPPHDGRLPHYFNAQGARP